MSKFSDKLKNLVEDDLAKMMGKPVINKKLWLWMVVDFFLIQLLIGPCNVLIWRGGWELYDLVFGVDRNNGIGLFISGLLLSIPLIIFSSNLSIFANDILTDETHGSGSFRYVIVTRFYSAATFFVMLMFWKGWFDIWRDFPFHIPGLAHWHFSLSCLVLGSFILMYLGCFKTAALSPPMGMWLDTATHYVHVDQFYHVKNASEKPMQFRFVNAILTLLIEVIGLVTYYGAYTLIDDWFHVKITEMFESSSLQASAFLLGWALLLSALSYVCSILYLYILFESTSQYCNTTIKNICYDSILFISVIATALHFHVWWGVTDVIKNEVFGDSAYPEFIFLCLGFLVTMFLGVGSGNHYGVSWENLKEEDGVLLPFIYLTYILRDRSMESQDDNMAVDVMVDFIEDHIVTE